MDHINKVVQLLVALNEWKGSNALSRDATPRVITHHAKEETSERKLKITPTKEKKRRKKKTENNSPA